jgi:cytochrome b6-f complex iron-sulfur subunit
MADEEAPQEAEAEAAAGKPAVRAAGAVSAGGGHAVVVAQPAQVGPTLPALPQVSRRGVVRLAFWGGLGTVLLGIVATILNSVYPRGVTGFGGTVFGGTVDSLEPGVPRKVTEAKAWLLKLDAEQAERNGGQEGAILALYQKCPHLGCSVPWREDYSYEDPRSGSSYSGWFLCPCHGSTYSSTGTYVFGPAPRSMDTFGLVIENGNITINTGQITPGAEDNGSRAVLPG